VALNLTLPMLIYRTRCAQIEGHGGVVLEDAPTEATDGAQHSVNKPLLDAGAVPAGGSWTGKLADSRAGSAADYAADIDAPATALLGGGGGLEPEDGEEGVSDIVVIPHCCARIGIHERNAATGIYWTTLGLAVACLALQLASIWVNSA
jgi:hypothetical protein